MSEEKSGQATEELDLQAILKKAEQQTTFPDVPLDEFEPPFNNLFTNVLPGRYGADSAKEVLPRSG